MNKKEFELGVVCLLVCGSLLFATPYPNKQKIYSLDSDVYEAISVLYVDQGLSLPSTTAPYSQAELEMMLKKLNPDRMGEAAKATYTYVCDQLGIQPQITGSSIGMTWQVGANLETYFHTNTTDFVGRTRGSGDSMNRNRCLHWSGDLAREELLWIFRVYRGKHQYP
jgi:hypothetical protein